MKQLNVITVILTGIALAIPAGIASAQVPTPLIQFDFEGDLANSGSLGTDYNGVYEDGAGALGYETGTLGSYLWMDNGDDGVARAYGEGDRIVVPFGLDTLTTGSMSFWAREDKAFNYNNITGCPADGSDWEIWYYGDQTRGDQFRARLGNNTTVGTNPGAYNMEGFGNYQWNHYTVTWDYSSGTSAAMQLFQNGVKVDSVSDAAWAASGSEFYIGGGVNNDYGTFSMDDFRLYGTVLTDEQAYNVYNARNEIKFANAFTDATAADAKVHYNFNQQGGGQGIIIPNVGTLANQTDPVTYAWTVNGNGTGSIGFVNDPERGQVLKIDQDYVIENMQSYHAESDYTLNPNGGTEEGTVAFWLNIDEFVEGGTLFDSGINNEWEAFLFEDGYMRFIVCDEAYVTVNMNEIGTDAWSHVAFRWMRDSDNPSQVSIWAFINGEEVDYDEGTYTISTMPLGIGSVNPGNDGGSFMMDDFMAFDVALSDESIAQLAAEVPEPSTLALLSSALVGLGLAFRRR